MAGLGAGAGRSAEPPRPVGSPRPRHFPARSILFFGGLFRSFFRAAPPPRELRYLLSAGRRNSRRLSGSRRVFCRRCRPAAAPLPRGLPWRRFPRVSRRPRRAKLDSDTDTHGLSTAAPAPGPVLLPPPSIPRLGGRIPRPPPAPRRRGPPCPYRTACSPGLLSTSAPLGTRLSLQDKTRPTAVGTGGDEPGTRLSFPGTPQPPPTSEPRWPPSGPPGAPLPVPGLSAAAEPSSAPKGQKPEPGLAMAQGMGREGKRSGELQAPAVRAGVPGEGELSVCSWKCACKMCAAAPGGGGAGAPRARVGGSSARGRPRGRAAELPPRS